MMKYLHPVQIVCLILAGVILIVNDARGAEGDLWLDLHIGSKHSRSHWTWDTNIMDMNGNGDILAVKHDEYRFREFNPGAGITYETTNNISISSGFVINSYDNLSVYTMFDFHTDSRARFSYGISVGPITGYLDTPEATWLMVQPHVTMRTTKNTRARLGAQPFGTVSYLTLSGSVRF